MPRTDTQFEMLGKIKQWPSTEYLDYKGQVMRQIPRVRENETNGK